MCGFLVYRNSNRGDNFRIQRRGPDATATVSRGGFTFVHNLLSVTGTFTMQPFVSDEVICLFNGEIYNHPYERSDGEVLIPLYERHGPAFPRLLEGEFALALYDFRREVIVFATDAFKTKPMFLNGVECASYRSGVGGEKANPNEIVVKDFSGRVLDRSVITEWDLTQQKGTYDDWITAFEHAITRRAKPGCFIGLSSGYDSGAIACELLRQKVPFKAFVFEGSEDPGILERRRALAPCQSFTPDPDLLAVLRTLIDDEAYTIINDGAMIDKRVLEDGATLGVATIARLASGEGRKVALSGQGADEIMSDYSPWPSQSELKGVFPERLRFWPNFNHSCQESYLVKEEYAAGAFGIENRYPFLDVRVVQEFLWLTAEAKNRYYKAPLREYLRRHQFPFEEGAKRGFFVDLVALEAARVDSLSV